MSVKEKWERLLGILIDAPIGDDWWHGEVPDQFDAAARDLALEPLLEVQKGLGELRDAEGTYHTVAPAMKLAFHRALNLVNAQIEAVRALGREPRPHHSSN